MKVTVDGVGPVTLGQGDFLAQGGEGAVYVRGTIAYKVYNTLGKMIPEGKISELASIQNVRVIKPDRIIRDASNRAIGYTMRYVSDTQALCRMFTRDFRDRNGVDHALALKIIRSLQDNVKDTHAAGVLVVDLNELNFLLAKSLDEVFSIDVDSYQTRSFRATALMESVRDRHAALNTFNTGTDWFAFAIVSFQLFVGIHPYKGKHPTLKDLDARMSNNVSVLDSAVRVPHVCYPFSVIPSAYFDWYRAVLQDGKRVPPPDGLVAATAAVATSIVRGVTSGSITITELIRFGETPRAVYVSVDHVVGVLQDGVELRGQVMRLPIKNREVTVGFVAPLNDPVVVWIDGESLRLFDVAADRDLPITVNASALMTYEGRIYAKSGERIVEVCFHGVRQRRIASVTVAGNVMEHASQVLDGVVIQSLLGAMWISIFPQSGQCVQVRVRELDGYRVVAAKYDRGVLVVVGNRAGQYDKLIFDVPVDSARLVKCVADVDSTPPNFVVTDSGVCATIDENEELVLAKGGKERRVADTAIGGDMRLVRHEGRVAFVRGDQLYRLTVS